MLIELSDILALAKSPGEREYNERIFLETYGNARRRY